MSTPKVYYSFYTLTHAREWRDTHDSLYYFGERREWEKNCAEFHLLHDAEVEGRVFWCDAPEGEQENPTFGERLDRFIVKAEEMGLSLPKNWRETHPEAFWNLWAFCDLIGEIRLQH
jgi:hypothetical protein